MSECITIETICGKDGRGYERIKDAFGLFGDWCDRVQGRFMRDAIDEFERAGYEQTCRVLVGDVIRYTFERRPGAVPVH